MSPRGATRGVSLPGTRSSVEVAPLSHRVAAMGAFRLAQLAVVAVLARVHDTAQPVSAAVVLAYLIATSALGLLVLTPMRSAAVKGFGAALLIDGVFLQHVHERLGHGPGADTVLAAQLVAVCLLASFRTGLKLAVWQSVLMVFFWRAEQTGLIPVSQAMAGLNRQATIGTDMSLLWLVVLTTSVAASINERELRRRRYDAEALERFAATLLSDDRPQDVAQRLIRFAVAELGVTRAAVLTRTEGQDGSLQIVAGEGLATSTGPGGPRSALLDLAASAQGTVRALRLDRRRDPGLSAMFPNARRIAAVPLRVGPAGVGGHGGQLPVSITLVVEFGGGGLRGGQVERRTVSSAAQAGATAALALSRAQLLADARRAAVTDGLTGLANRRFFDETMQACERAWRENGVPFALVLTDVDHFKSVNDRYGHQFGDQVLVAVARALGAHATGGALAARYGGEEFALVIPGADTAAAATIAERARRAVREIAEPVSVSSSFGVAAVPEDAAGADEVVLSADAALLQAKALGRDRVVVYEPTVAALG